MRNQFVKRISRKFHFKFSSWIFFSAVGLIATASMIATAEPAPSPLSIEEAIDGIKARSPRLTAKTADRDSAQVTALESKMQFLPSLSVKAAKNWSGSLFSDSESKTLYLQSDLNLWSWGADWAGAKATSLLADASEQGLAQEEFDVEVESLRTITQFLRKKRTIEITEKLVSTRKRLVEISEVRFNRGILPKQEVEKLEIDLANSESELSSANEAFLAAQAELQAALGHSEIKTQWPWKERIRKFLKDFVLKTDVDPSIRPDWLAAQSAMNAQEQISAAAQRRLLPSLGAAGNWGHLQTETYKGPNWSAALTISFPLFDHLETYSKYRREHFGYVAREADFFRTDRRVRAEMQNIQKQTQISLQSAVNRDKTYESSQKLYEQSVRRFELGRVSANDLALDQRRAYDSELLSIDGWSEAHLSFLRYCHAFGKSLKNCF